MLVQRLTKRLATLLSGLAERVRGALTSLRPTERGAATGGSPDGAHLSAQQSGSWLDDAHRLRRQRAALATADQNRGKQGTSGEPRSGAHSRPVMPPAPAQARRRLMSLRYLVRIGLYNEGFAPSAVPEQYQRSLGADDESDSMQ